MSKSTTVDYCQSYNFDFISLCSRFPFSELSVLTHVNPADKMQAVSFSNPPEKASLIRMLNSRKE